MVFIEMKISLSMLYLFFLLLLNGFCDASEGIVDKPQKEKKTRVHPFPIFIDSFAAVGSHLDDRGSTPPLMPRKSQIGTRKPLKPGKETPRERSSYVTLPAAASDSQSTRQTSCPNLPPIGKVKAVHKP